jgi:hypothetical protein
MVLSTPSPLAMRGRGQIVLSLWADLREKIAAISNRTGGFFANAWT